MNNQKRMEVPKSSDKQPKPRQNPYEKAKTPNHFRKKLSAQTQTHEEPSNDLTQEIATQPLLEFLKHK